MLSQRPKRALLRGNPGSGKRLCQELGGYILLVSLFENDFKPGVRSLGGKFDTNHLISLASFEEDGSAEIAPQLEDFQGHHQYKTSQAHFHSLQDYRGCGNLREFLRNRRQKIKEIQDIELKKDKKRKVGLFLQDLPVQGRKVCIYQSSTLKASDFIKPQSFLITRITKHFEILDRNCYLIFNFSCCVEWCS